MYLLADSAGLVPRSLRAIRATAVIRAAICRRVKPSGKTISNGLAVVVVARFPESWSSATRTAA